ncbi:hypothetical protein ZWY2020_048513 [Hordeum vulgare]|nr:hypothetical protein ZWY2020_048513 [Hordeum vulgare]
MTLSLDAHLSAAITSSSDGENHISVIPDTLLCNVVSHLPVKDAAHTGALSHRWRGLWRATPLALDDAHLLSSSVTTAALVTTFLALAEWLGHLADKGVEDLTLINRPFSFDVPVQHPGTLLRCGASLRHFYLGVWLFPFTTNISRGPDVFPNLQELGLCHGITEERDLEYVLACSPKLETLALISNYSYPDRVRVGSRSLRCVLLLHSLADEVAVVSAPSLQRLIIYCTHTSEADGVIKVKLGHAPQLVVLGYFDTATHQLEIGNTIIKVLALKVRFRVPKEVRTLLCFLRCFRGVETLHIMSNNDTDHYDDPGEVKPGDKLNSTFWKGVGPIKCLKSRVKKLVFDHPIQSS